MSRSLRQLEKSRWLIFLFIAASFLLFFRSLNYDFVYDDKVRILNNEKIHSLPSLADIFMDPQLQSTRPVLNSHTYRPLMVLDFSIDYALWKDSPTFYRVKNILLHGVNSFLVFSVGMVLFRLHFLGAIFCGVFFLVHPSQVESVVWISSRTNLVLLLFLLLGVLAWVRFRRENNWNFYWLTLIMCSLALLVRESAFCFPIFLLIADKIEAKSKKSFLSKKTMMPYLGIGVLLLVYVAVRTAVLGQVSQAGFWGDSFLNNLATVFSVFPLYWKNILIPINLSVNYLPEIMSSFFHVKVVLGMVLLSFLVYLFWIFLKRDVKVSGCILGLLVFWLPTSNLVPLTHLFNDRWLYILLPFVGWLLALTMASSKKRKTKKDRKVAVASVVLSFYLVVTLSYIPVWENNYTLWSNAIKVKSDIWFNWFCLGKATRDRALDTRKNEDMYNAGLSYRKALSLSPPKEYVPELWLYLAEVNMYLGARDQAEQCAKEAIALDPKSSTQWENLIKRFESS